MGLNMMYSPYIPLTVTSPEDTNQKMTNSNNLTTTGVFDSTVSVSEGNTVLWTNTGPPPTNFTLGSNMSASFVHDRFVEVKTPGSSHPLYQRMSQNEMTGAQLHPLLKKVVEEANTLEKENRSLKESIETYGRALKDANANADGMESLKAEKAELERKLSNQQHNITELQLELVELHDAHDALRQVIRDYSEESVNEIVQDYQTQIAHYESMIQDYERTQRSCKQEQVKFVEVHYSKEAIDKMIADAKTEGKLELLTQQDKEVSHEDRMINIGPGVKVWQTSTGAGPFWTQTPKTFRHNDKEKSASPGWLVHNTRGKPEHYPVGDLVDKEPVHNGPNKLVHVVVGAVNAIAMQLVAIQAFGLKAIIPMTVAQTLMAAFTYRDVFKISK